jgi:hypothetical protein
MLRLTARASKEGQFLSLTAYGSSSIVQAVINIANAQHVTTAAAEPGRDLQCQMNRRHAFFSLVDAGRTLGPSRRFQRPRAPEVHSEI